ncbi:MAG: molecular chaperone TorD family protein [Dehalococcoidia bacterium]
MSDRICTSTLSKKEQAAQALGRSGVYLFLSRCFLFPEEPLEELKEEAATSLQGLGESELAQALKDLPLPRLEELRRQYVGVFGHGTSQDFPQYETENEKSHISSQSQTLAEIAGCYGYSGLAVAQGERLDHIGVELEFLYFLAHKEAYALGSEGGEKVGACQDAQREFFGAHLGRWGPSFFHRLVGVGGFYGELSGLAGRFFSREGETLGIDIEELSPGASTAGDPETYAWEDSFCGEASGADADCL